MLKILIKNPYAKGDIVSLLKVSFISCKKPLGVFRTFWKLHIFLVRSRLVSYCEYFFPCSIKYQYTILTFLSSVLSVYQGKHSRAKISKSRFLYFHIRIWLFSCKKLTPAALWLLKLSHVCTNADISFLKLCKEH